MSRIAGIAQPDSEFLVKEMLDRISHRSNGSRVSMTEAHSATLGMVPHTIRAEMPTQEQDFPFVCDAAGSERRACAMSTPSGLVLERDPLGVAPLYYGYTGQGRLCFASEVKALLVCSRNIRILPPGHRLTSVGLICLEKPGKKTPLRVPPEVFASELRSRLEAAVLSRLDEGNIGSWLSGGIDSSGLAALARRHVQTLHTFSAGLAGSPDLEYAQVCSSYIDSKHHEIVVKPEILFSILPEVIYYLESFDALLVRSSLMNFLVAKLASDYVPAVLSGEAGDELFAGYSYLKAVPKKRLAGELIDITSRLHNTALQRVDRCASAHGIVAHLPFLDPQVVSYALEIPVQYKLYDGNEKWILRKALAGAVPDLVLNRPKAKFWEGAGVGEILAEAADGQISNAEFERERQVSDRIELNSKEELMYYRIFRSHFGEFEDISWMGRTKGASPANNPNSAFSSSGPGKEMYLS
jgi:asparagine synthase (glutamine-hydrolysing)